MNKIVLIILLIANVDSFAQQEIFATDSNGDLYSFNLENCTRTFIGSTSIGFGDIAFTTNNNLWGVENGNLYQINKLNGSTTFINTMGIYPVSLVGVNDTLLFAEDQMNLYSINTINADTHLIGNIGYSANGDLIWDGKTLFMLTPFVKIELNSSLTGILNITPITSSVPSSEGSVLYGENYYTLVCFSGGNVYEVCQLDGSYHTLCSDLNVDGIPGAASTINYVNPLNLINVFSPNSDGINDYFQLNSDLDKIEYVVIINRWGEQIANLGFPFIWDGKLHNGDLAADGVYFYLIKLNEDCVTKNFEQGVIHLIK